MASAAEIRGQVDAANNLVNEAWVAMSTAVQKLRDAVQLHNMTDSTMLQQAVQLLVNAESRLEEARQLSQMSKESASAYAVSL